MRSGVIKKDEKSYWYVILLCLLTPAISDLVRKFIEGQPNYVTPAASAVVVSCATIWALLNRKKMSIKIREPLLYWIAFLSIYIVLGALVDIRVGIAAVFLRILPMAMAVVAYKSINSQKDFERLTFSLSVLPLLLMPIGIIVLLSGNQALPFYFRPLEIMNKLGRDFRGGFDTCAATFATAAIMANSLSGVFFLTLSATIQKSKRQLFYVVSLFSSLFLIYMSVRRGDLYIVLAGVVFYFFMVRKKRNKVFFAILAGIMMLYFADQQGYVAQDYAFTKRHEVMVEKNADQLSMRFKDVFLYNTIGWMNKNPIGTFIGFAGMEGAIYGVNTKQNVETGSAQLAAETGIIGVLFMPVILIMVWRRLWVYSNKSVYQHQIHIMIFGAMGLYLLYYTKVITALSSLYMAQLVFWAIPGLCLALVKIGEKNSLVGSSPSYYRNG